MHVGHIVLVSTRVQLQTAAVCAIAVIPRFFISAWPIFLMPWIQDLRTALYSKDRGIEKITHRSMNIVLAKDKKHEFTGGQTICVESNHELNMFLTERCTHSALAKMIETCLFLLWLQLLNKVVSLYRRWSTLTMNAESEGKAEPKGLNKSHYKSRFTHFPNLTDALGTMGDFISPLLQQNGNGRL